MTPLDDMALVEEFVEILNQLRIPVVIGGSIASSIHGAVRFTQDADLCVEPFDEQMTSFLDRVRAHWYVSDSAVQYALRHRTSFNLIHLQTAFKIDVFVRQNNPFDSQIIPRRQYARLTGSSLKECPILSPEDTILMKMRWYVEGGMQSQRQWDDMLGVLRIQRDKLDMRYLELWALRWNNGDLLDRLIHEAGLDSL
jgi:hypothetical protein